MRNVVRELGNLRGRTPKKGVKRVFLAFLGRFDYPEM
jgi:hypothetical protein